MRKYMRLCALALMLALGIAAPVRQAQAFRQLQGVPLHNAPYAAAASGAAAFDAPAIANPILFVTQVPVPGDYTTIASVFGNQRADMDRVGRGGDLWIRYTDGSLKNLTAAAGYGVATSLQTGGGIALRDPSMYWDGTKAIFSMVVGAPGQYAYTTYHWQLYEVSGLGPTDTPGITLVPHQPAGYNNVSPLYGNDDHIIFTTDRPRNGAPNLYPQLDEYEEAPTVTGLWNLDPTTGGLFMMNHLPSGAFTPSLDSFGRVIFTRWDHLQRDQQADTDVLGGNQYGTFNYTDESPSSTAQTGVRTELFPEPRPARTDLLSGTNLAGHTFNHFLPWAIREDGTGEETINHVGRHELVGYIPRSLTDDNNLFDFYNPAAQFNQNRIENFLQIKESAASPGTYYAVDAPEFSTHASGQVISMTAPPLLDADQMRVTYVTHRDTAGYTPNPGPNHSGHYRDPLPMSDGTLVASHTFQTDLETSPGSTTALPHSNYDFRLKTLALSPNGYWTPSQTLTLGISRTVTYWNPDTLVTVSGPLWELQPVEVRARPRPARLVPSLAVPEQQAIANAGVSLAALQAYLVSHNLAIAVSRNVTTRDHSDKQQPFNLRIAGGGAQTIGAAGKIYDLAYIQFFQADQLRGLAYNNPNAPVPGRRVIAQYLHDPAAAAANRPAPAGPQSSQVLASDGSMAAFVPAQRAMTWQLTDGAGTGVVRERMWITFQPGEVRACASCHGLNETDQAGNPAPENTPQALTDLLTYWKSTQAPGNSLFLPLMGR
jgi:hypothetical protein